VTANGVVFKKADPDFENWGEVMAGRLWSQDNHSKMVLGRSGGVAIPVMIAALAVVLAVGGCGAPRRSSIAWGEGSGLLEIRPYSGDISRVLSNVRYLKLMGRQDLALKELESAYRQAPEQLQVANELAQVYEDLGEFERAEKVYQEALARHGGHAALHNNLCFSYYQAGKWEKAEACFREVLARHPENTTARNNLGLLLCRLGRQAEAHALWRAAEGEAVAQNKLQQVLAALGLPEPRESMPQYARPPSSDSAPLKTASAEGRQKGGFISDDEQPLGGEQQKVAVAISPQRPQELCQARVLKPGKPEEIAAFSEPGEAEEEEPQAISRLKGSSLKPSKEDSKAGANDRQDGATVPENEAQKPQNSAEENKVSPPVTPQPPKQTEPLRKLPRPVVTAEELSTTAIEVLNGNGMVGLAKQTRSLLDSEGYQVVSIGNHRDWGAEKTVIYYRPEAQKVAQALQGQFFQQAQLQPKEDLPQDIDIRLLLGRDLMAGQELLARVLE